jgi:two-component system cell cycle sensor histidine kinase/response regulator CckA
MTSKENGSGQCGGAILVVDDDDDLRDSLCELLELHGFHTVAARDGIEALARLHGSERVCFMVLDLVMPRMNGIQLLRAVADDAQLHGLGLCVSSSSVEQAPRGVPLLEKPIDVKRLIAMVQANCTKSDCRQSH